MWKESTGTGQLSGKSKCHQKYVFSCGGWHDTRCHQEMSLIIETWQHKEHAPYVESKCVWALESEEITEHLCKDSEAGCQGLAGRGDIVVATFRADPGGCNIVGDLACEAESNP
jgi:hypothetical protein